MSNNTPFTTPSTGSVVKGDGDRITLKELVFPNKGEEHADPVTDYIAVQLMPNLPTKSGARNCVTLKPGESFRLDGEMDELALFFDWTVKDPSAVIDVDAAAALFNKNLEPRGFVWWDQLQTPCQSVRFLSQDETTGVKQGTKEEIRIHTKDIPDDVTYIVLTASIYSKDYEMQDLQDLSLTIKDLSCGYDLVTYKVEGIFQGRSMLIGCLIRNGEFWSLYGMQGAMLSRTISEIMHESGNLYAVSMIKPKPRVRKHVTFLPVEGRDLTPMDFSLFSKRADPYLKIFYDDQLVMSEVCKATLTPKFKCPSIDFGEVSETCTKVVEIQVWDWDRITEDDNMGVARFCLGGLVANLYPGENKVWFKVFPLEEHNVANKKITGQIGVVVNCVVLD